IEQALCRRCRRRRPSERRGNPGRSPSATRSESADLKSFKSRLQIERRRGRQWDDDRRTSEKERRKFRKDSCAPFPLAAVGEASRHDQQERERGDAATCGGRITSLNDRKPRRYFHCNRDTTLREHLAHSHREPIDRQGGV